MSEIKTFSEIKAGDAVTRMLGGAPMRLKVHSVDDKFIYCGPPGVGWKFSRGTGAEVDEELGWGEEGTGSYLTAEREEAKP